MERLGNIENAGQNLFDQMAENFSDTWANSELIIGTDAARKLIGSFNPKYSYVLLEPPTNFLLAQIHTIPAYAESITDFIDQFRTYDTALKAAQGEPPPNANFLICFSLNCKPGIKIGEEGIPLPRFVLKNLPNPHSLYKIGFSFMTAVDPKQTDAYSMMKRYLELLKKEDTRSGGPAMMHEAFGGVVVAFLPHARPEHTSAAGGITLVVYPKNDAEYRIFEKVKEERRKWGLPAIGHNGAVILTDVHLANLNTT